MFAKTHHNINGTMMCFAFLLVLCAVFTVLTPYFASFTNLQNVITASAVIGIMALGATFVIGSNNIDLSSASIMALSGVVCAVTIKNHAISPFIAVLLCMGVGGLCGVVTAILINITRAPSFIITLGMMSVARAIAYLISDGMPVYDLPEAVTALGREKILGVSGPVIFVILTAIAAYYLLHKTRFGNHTLFLGDNATAAEAMGIEPARLRLKIFGLAGLCSGLAGFVFMARTNTGDPTAGMNYELMAITAVILGGSNLFGGRASILGTIIGVACLGILQNGLNLMAVSTYYQVLFVGIVLVAAAALNRWRRL